MLEPYAHETKLSLPDFQLQAIQHATSIIGRRGGVLIADSVGLGKTFVALGLVERAIRDRRSVAIVVPAALRRMWRTELRKIGLLDRVELLSHTRLALHGLRHPADFVVIDEAHAFRNPRTRRYVAARRACRGAQTVLLTATPVNNSLWDLYFQLRLVCVDSAFRDLGIGSLRGAFAEGRDVDRILRAIMVRRTRAEVRSTAADLNFPGRVQMHTVPYVMPLEPLEIRQYLFGLSFVAHGSARNSSSPDLLRFALLKRMESSGRAAHASLSRLLRFYEEFIAALERGRVLEPAAFRSLYAVADDALQLVLEDVLLAPVAAVRRHVLDDARADLALLRRWRAELSGVGDDKLAQLERVLAARPAKARTLIFSEYRDTARYLWRALRRRYATGLIDGGGAWIGEARASRAQVVERFAPIANAARSVHPREAILVLIATDVLAEGMNLQDADAVISYDLPWNPVRLIQRAGRIDRIGSPHEQVSVYNFIPDREFDELLGLAGTIRTKLETVRSTVGLERPVLEPGDSFAEFARGLRAAQPGLLDRIESGSAARLRAAFLECEPVRATGTPVGSLSRHRPRRLLVGLARGGDWDVVVLDRESGREMGSGGVDELLLEALGVDEVRPVEPGRWVAVVADYLRSRQRASSTAKLDRDAPAGALAAAIRSRLAGSLRDAELFTRADLVLERLAGSDGAFAEARLEALVSRPWRTLEDLLDAAESALAQYGKPSANDSAKEAEWHVTAVIIAD